MPKTFTVKRGDIVWYYGFIKMMVISSFNIEGEPALGLVFIDQEEPADNGYTLGFVDPAFVGDFTYKTVRDYKIADTGQLDARYFLKDTEDIEAVQAFIARVKRDYSNLE